MAGFRIGDLASIKAGKMPALQILLVQADVPRAGKMPALQQNEDCSQLSPFHRRQFRVYSAEHLMI
jgi:hypothetical protein